MTLKEILQWKGSCAGETLKALKQELKDFGLYPVRNTEAINGFWFWFDLNKDGREVVRSLLLEIFSSGVEDNQPAKVLGKGNPSRS